MILISSCLEYPSFMIWKHFSSILTTIDLYPLLYQGSVSWLLESPILPFLSCPSFFPKLQLFLWHWYHVLFLVYLFFVWKHAMAMAKAKCILIRCIEIIFHWLGYCSLILFYRKPPICILLFLPYIIVFKFSYYLVISGCWTSFSGRKKCGNFSSLSNIGWRTHWNAFSSSENPCIQSIILIAKIKSFANLRVRKRYKKDI